MDVAVTTGSTLWSGLAGPFPGRRDEGAGPRQTPREGQGLGAGGRGAWQGLRAGGRGARAGGCCPGPSSAAHVSAEWPRAGPPRLSGPAGCCVCAQGSSGPEYWLCAPELLVP